MKISAMPAMGPSYGQEGNLKPVEQRMVMQTKEPTPNEVEAQKLPIPDTSGSTTKVADEVTQPLSPQLADLARRRRALQVKERELALKQKELETARTGRPSVDISQLKERPLSVLLENGITYDQLTQELMNNPGSSEIEALKRELKEVREGIDKKFVEKDELIRKEALLNINRDVKQMVETSQDFELVHKLNHSAQVTELIDRWHRDTGELLDIEKAAKMVEDQLYEDLKPITESRLFKSATIPQSQDPLPNPKPQGMRTLTNRDTASAVLDRKARALAAFYGNLKK